MVKITREDEFSYNEWQPSPFMNELYSKIVIKLPLRFQISSVLSVIVANMCHKITRLGEFMNSILNFIIGSATCTYKQFELLTDLKESHHTGSCYEGGVMM